MNEILPTTLREILLGLPQLRQALLVGGCVRDWRLGLPVKDFDVEVYGVGVEELCAGLARVGRVDQVGRSFGVVKLTVARGETYDFSLPRRDSKIAPGHKGFVVEVDTNLPPEKAVLRRDFTINALMFDPRRGRVLDFCGGEEDLRARVLRHTGAAFVEDPLRVLRGMQFCARFQLTPAPETVALCRSIHNSFAELAVERVRDEWFKWASLSIRPSLGLDFLEATGWIEHFPEIAGLRGVPQDPDWHPEGDVFVHTRHCCDAMAKLEDWRKAVEPDRQILMLSILAHDFGKPSTTRREVVRGVERIISPGHEAAGVPLAESFLQRLGAPLEFQKRVPPLVREHLAHMQALSAKGIRRLARRLAPETIESLALVMRADAMGRPPKPPVPPPQVQELLEAARSLSVADQEPKPILLGRHLIARGLKPGKAMGTVLTAAFEAQLEGAFADLPGALEWLDRRSG